MPGILEVVVKICVIVDWLPLLAIPPLALFRVGELQVNVVPGSAEFKLMLVVAPEQMEVS